MSNAFFERPILNSPYEAPATYWELDEDGQPTHNIIKKRRPSKALTPIPKSKKQTKVPDQAELDLYEQTVSTQHQKYNENSKINQLRGKVDQWRSLSNPADWRVSSETARLLQHWRTHHFANFKPFFCQVEAVETVIYLTEVAPYDKDGKIEFIEYLKDANNNANPELFRLALKLATGAGKTTVMAMLIAWQTINSVCHPGSNKFTHGFLVVTPGLTIKERLRVLQPNDPDSYYRSRELVPIDMLADLGKAKIVITNYHSFKLRDTLEISAGGRALLKGRTGADLITKQTEGQMLQDVMPSLMGMKNIMVLNDEAHHCYREKPGDPDEEITKEDAEEAKSNKEAARLWINGLEIVKRKLGINCVIDLSATPFFLRGSGYAEGTLFPWTMCDFSLMDAIECGIVKLPRVPVSDNSIGSKDPQFRVLWQHIGGDLPKGNVKNSRNLDPKSLPTLLKSALDALYGHYKETFELWEKAQIDVAPCLIIVCQNTAISDLVFRYISGYHKTNKDGSVDFQQGKMELFRNFDENGERFARPLTFLIDSAELESDDALDPRFREMAADEIDRFRREKMHREQSNVDPSSISDKDLLREVMNTVGKKDRLGETIRCVVSVSMLTEGWDANNVTHILGIRAFGTQLLCEQVIGRALRRQSYDLNEHGLFDVEYADVLGIPFDFTAEPVVSKPQRPSETILVKAISPDRDAGRIDFPRVLGYRVDLPTEKLQAQFTKDSKLILDPMSVGPSSTQVEGIIGKPINLSFKHLDTKRELALAYQLAAYILDAKWRIPGETPPNHLFNDLKNISYRWIRECLECKPGIYPAQLMNSDSLDKACEIITAAITKAMAGAAPIKAILDPYNPTGSTKFVQFNTSKTLRWKTAPHKCHINWVIADSDWELEFCRIAENHPQVLSYVKNHGLQFEVPYRLGSVSHKYRPDFILKIDDGEDDPLNLIVEIKGYRGEDAKFKKDTMDTYWIPGVNNMKQFGRWAFAEFTDIFEMEQDFKGKMESQFNTMIDASIKTSAKKGQPVGS